MKLMLVLAALIVLLGPASCGILNFNSKYMTFFRGSALFDDWKYEGVIGAAVILAGIAAAQYGFLPLRDSTFSERLGNYRHNGRISRRISGHPGYRVAGRRAQFTSSDDYSIQSYWHNIITVGSALLEEAIEKYRDKN